MADKDREFLPAWAMSWDDISDSQLAEVIGKEFKDNLPRLVGKLRAYYQDKYDARITALEAELTQTRAERDAAREALRKEIRKTLDKE